MRGPLGLSGGGRGNHGYLEGMVTYTSGVRARRLVHRLVCEAFNGPPPFPGAIVRHLDGCPTNNLPANLAWGTKRDNTHDAMRHGTIARGVRHGAAKLTEAGVRDIRQRAAAGESDSSIARAYGVDPANVRAIRTGRSWSWLD